MYRGYVLFCCSITTQWHPLQLRIALGDDGLEPVTAAKAYTDALTPWPCNTFTSLKTNLRKISIFYYQILYYFSNTELCFWKQPLVFVFNLLCPVSLF